MFRFANPEYLDALYLLPLLVVVFWLLSRNKKKLLDNFADKELHKILLPSNSFVKKWIKLGVLLIAIVCLVFAAANPQVGTKMQEVKQSGIDVFFFQTVWFYILSCHA